MIINEKLKEVINEYQKEINNNEWKDIYNGLMFIDEKTVGQFTEIMLEAGINPLYYMIDIPRYFAHTANIKTIDIPNNITNVGQGAFESCRELTTINLPDGVVNIDIYAFAHCSSLISISIPSSVKDIGGYAFTKCTNLKDIYFSGTKTQWHKIKKRYTWDEDAGDYIIHCKTGDIKKNE